MLVLVLPWLVAIGYASHGAFFAQALGHDFAGKLVGGQESHGAPPGYYLILSAITLWPATLFVLPGIGHAISARATPGLRFLLGWAGANWLLFAFVPTKLPHYILPVYPALAFLAALWLTSAEETGGGKPLRILAVAQFAIGSAAIAAAIVFVPVKFGDGAPLWLMALAALGGAAGLTAAALMLWRRRLPALAVAVLAALIFYPTLMWGVAPRLTRIWVSPRLAALVARDSRPGDPAPVAAGYDEPSLVFLLGTGTRLVTGARAADIAAGRGGLALIEDRQRPAFLAKLVDLGASAQPLDQLSGINYSRGKPVHITIYRVRAVPRTAWVQ